ncbi:MAG TPA: hypothetical protein PLV21_11215 [Cyclobacteriaceae bacterium]|nr:hypothetical protein [Cyclobacteriaceae bacterium]HRJ82449.1 hypothetical protein [Cyclobacteriaceae bacterium]
MKTRVNLMGRNIFIATMLVFLFTACAKKVTFLNSAVVPAAEVTVVIKRDKNKNYNIDLTVDRLADPGRLTPPKSVYVVWMETSQSGSQNIGQLKTSKRGISQKLTSSLKTVTPHQPTGFFITAEDDAIGNYHGMTVVLKTAAIVNK